MTFNTWIEKRGVWPRLTYEEIWNAAKETQREECAKICDDFHYIWRIGDGEDSMSGPKECAKTIRESLE